MEGAKAVDLFGRHIEYIRISVTQRCNLRCSYCVSGEAGQIYPNDDLIKLKDLARLMEIYAKLGLNKVRLTGGEPLMRKGIVTLIKDLKGIEGIKTVTMTTNGLMLGDKLTQLYDAGLDRINISLDSLRPERLKEVTGVDTHEKVMGVIKRIVDDGVWDLKINAVAMKGFNDDEILDFADMVYSMPIEMRFIEKMPVGSDKLAKDYAPLYGEDIKRKIEEKYKLVPVKKSKDSGPAEVFSLEGGKGKIGLISPLSKHFCNSCNRMRLTAEGKLRSCLFDDNEIGLKPGFDNGEPDEWFVQKLREAIESKQEKHSLDIDSTGGIKRTMISIGG